MKLFYRKKGEGRAVIICHGLYGMSDNWLSAARQLANNFEVYLPDMRNHGLSPHSENHSYFDLSSDIYELTEANNLQDVILIGHSMGGKACMQFAALYPEKVYKLIVIDISPRDYTGNIPKNKPQVNHNNILEFMINIDFKKINNRNEISDFICNKFTDVFTQQLLMKNIIKGDESLYRWKLNAKTLFEKHFELLKGVDFRNKKINIPTLFIKGKKSNYIQTIDIEYINENFSDFTVTEISRCGHLVHIENLVAMISAIRNFII